MSQLTEKRMAEWEITITTEPREKEEESPVDWYHWSYKRIFKKHHQVIVMTGRYGTTSHIYKNPLRKTKTSITHY